MKRSLILALSVVTAMTFVGCTELEEDTTQKESVYQEELAKQASDVVGMPEITNFYNKKMLKEIYEKTDDSKLVCYAYSQNLDGKFVYVGKCMGYGIPYSTQYTNPQKLIDDPNGSYEVGSAVIPQADPDGLYRPDGLTATWLMMIDDETGENYVMYCEPTIIVTEHKIPKRLVEAFSIAGINY